MFSKILHANDGSVPAFRAFALALDIAKQNAAALRMVVQARLLTTINIAAGSKVYLRPLRNLVPAFLQKQGLVQARGLYRLTMITSRNS